MSDDLVMNAENTGKCMAELHELDEGWTVTVTLRDNSSKTFACPNLIYAVDTMRREIRLHLESLEPGNDASETPSASAG